MGDPRPTGERALRQACLFAHLAQTTADIDVAHHAAPLFRVFNIRQHLHREAPFCRPSPRSRKRLALPCPYRPIWGGGEVCLIIQDRKSTRLHQSLMRTSYAVCCLTAQSPCTSRSPSATT